MVEVGILEQVSYFFCSPLWNDSIKDFILTNCPTFTGEDEFEHSHQKSHKDFCEMIENILTIYLLDGIGVTFEQFEAELLQHYTIPDSLAAHIFSVFAQATDFRYFASRMYYYNLMLDQQVMWNFSQDSPGGFFVTDGAYKEEMAAIQVKAAKASETISQIEKTLNVETPFDASISFQPPIIVSSSEISDQPEIEQPKAEQPKAEQPQTDQSETGQLNSIQPKSSQEIFAQPQDIDEAKKKVKDDIIHREKQKLRQEIDLNLSQRPKVEASADEDPFAAMRRALKTRVKVLIDETDATDTT